MTEESKKVWHYKIFNNSSEYLVIARTKEEAMEKVKNKNGNYPFEIYWKRLYNPEQTTYPKGTIY